VIAMSNAIVALVVIALMLTAALTWSQTAYTSFDSVSQALKQSTQTTQEVSRTDIKVVDTQTQGGFVEVSVLNEGEVHLAQFAKWDVLVQYYDVSNGYHIS
jgi:archaellum component FlaF (FlaF/FlaG flagellin family)